MSGENSKPDNIRTLTDQEIVTERKLPRRSFLSASGVLVAGAVGLVSAARAAAQDDPNKRPDDARKPEDTPKPDDAHKPEDEPKPEDKRKRRRGEDDPDKRPTDPDRTTDPHL